MWRRLASNQNKPKKGSFRAFHKQQHSTPFASSPENIARLLDIVALLNRKLNEIAANVLGKK